MWFYHMLTTLIFKIIVIISIWKTCWEVFHETRMPITASAILQLGVLCRNVICSFQKEMLSNCKLKKKTFHVGFSGGKMAVVMASGDVLLRRWQGPTWVFRPRLEEVEVTWDPSSGIQHGWSKSSCSTWVPWGFFSSDWDGEALVIFLNG